MRIYKFELLNVVQRDDGENIGVTMTFHSKAPTLEIAVSKIILRLAKMVFYKPDNPKTPCFKISIRIAKDNPEKEHVSKAERFMMSEISRLLVTGEIKDYE